MLTSIELYDQLTTQVEQASGEASLKELYKVLDLVMAKVDKKLASLEAEKPKKPGPKPGTKHNKKGNGKGVENSLANVQPMPTPALEAV